MIRLFPYRPHCAVARPFTSVTRWLLVVVGCTGLELVQPAFAADETVEPDRSGETLLYPKSSDDGAIAPVGDASLPNTGWVVVGLVLMGVGGWVWWQRRQLTNGGGARGLIGIEETRSLGNRQFLVVASCDGRRFLLGVSPGRISTLADLDEDSVPEFSNRVLATPPAQ